MKVTMKFSFRFEHLLYFYYGTMHDMAFSLSILVVLLTPLNKVCVQSDCKFLFYFRFIFLTLFHREPQTNIITWMKRHCRRWAPLSHKSSSCADYVSVLFLCSTFSPQVKCSFALFNSPHFFLFCTSCACLLVVFMFTIQNNTTHQSGYWTNVMCEMGDIAQMKSYPSDQHKTNSIVSMFVHFVARILRLMFDFICLFVYLHVIANSESPYSMPIISMWCVCVCPVYAVWFVCIRFFSLFSL